MAEPPKLHHTLPVFYQERFAKDEKVDVVDRENFGKFFTTSPKVAIAQNHFYSFDTDEGRDTSLETMLGEHVEGPAAEGMRRLVEGGRSLASRRIREQLSMFMAMQRVRGPGVREMLVEQFKASMRKTMTIAPAAEFQRMARLRGEEMTDEEAADLSEYARSGDYSLKVNYEANLHLGTVLKAAVQTAPLFDMRIWRLFEFEDPVLVTSDEPVAFVGRDQNVVGDAGGFMGAHAIVFTLDPRHALLMIRPDLRAEQERVRASAADAATINRHVVFGAHRYIVRHPGTDPLAGLAVPKRAPSVFVFDDVVAIQPNATEERRAAFLAKIARGDVKFRKPPDDDPDDEPA